MKGSFLSSLRIRGFAGDPLEPIVPQADRQSSESSSPPLSWASLPNGRTPTAELA